MLMWQAFSAGDNQLPGIYRHLVDWSGGPNLLPGTMACTLPIFYIIDIMMAVKIWKIKYIATA